MLDGTYKLAIDTPLGTKPGMVRLRVEGDKVKGAINAPVVGRQRFVGSLEGEDAFSAEGTLGLMFMGRIGYSLHGAVDGDSIRVTIESSRGDFNFDGVRTS